MDHVAQRVILKTAAATTLNSFSQAFIVALSGVTAVLTRLWLLDAGGELRLAGSFGRPVGGGSYNRLDGEFARMTPGTGKIGQMCVSREPFVARSLRGDESWLVNRDWIARQAVRAFLGYPLIAGDEVIGALAIFDRATPSDATLETLQFLADYAALRVIDLRERAALQAHRLASAESAPRSPADSSRTRF